MVLLLVSVTSCAQAPKPPVVDFYLHDAPQSVAYCSRSNHEKCDSVKIEDTDNWFLFPPEQLEKIQNYIDLLVCIIEGGCKDAQSGVLSTSVSLSPEDLRKISKLMRDLRTNLERQRNDNGNKLTL